MRFTKFVLKNYQDFLTEESLKNKLLNPDSNDDDNNNKNNQNDKDDKEDKELDRIMLLSGLKGDLKKVKETRGVEQRFDYRQKKIKKKNEIIDSFYFRGGLTGDIRRAGPGDNPLYNNLNDKFKNKK